jgi:hypothetical protein
MVIQVSVRAASSPLFSFSFSFFFFQENSNEYINLFDF